MKKCNIRHGDLALIAIDILPDNLTETNSNILMKGNHGHNHTFDTGKLYITKNSDTLEGEDFTFGYFVAENTTLFHEDHGTIIEGQKERIAKIPDGIYTLLKQKEYTPDGLKVVID